MKKTIILIFIILAATASAQVIEVQSINKVATPGSEMAKQVAAISPEGDYLLLCSQSQDGLMKLDLATGASDVLTMARGAGFGATVSDDGNTIVYQEVTINPEHLLMREVKTFDLTTSKIKEFVAPTRNLQGIDIVNGNVTAVVDNKVKTHSIVPGAITRPIVSNNNLRLMLTINGNTRQFAPNGDLYNYIWASISPNGKRVLYYVSELGCYTCRPDGSDMIELGELRAPRWLDDNTVVGMRDYDNGYTITASSIVAKTLDGTEQIVTDDDMIALFPQVSAKAGKIAFSTIEGDIFIINFTK